MKSTKKNAGDKSRVGVEFNGYVALSHAIFLVQIIRMQIRVNNLSDVFRLACGKVRRRGNTSPDTVVLKFICVVHRGRRRGR